MGALIRQIEYYFPENKITNEALAEKFPDYDFFKFEEKVGIKNRYWVSEGETALDLAIKACEKLFSKINKNDIDFILFCTQSPEYYLPTTACILQSKLGLKEQIGALDFNLGCSGYVYGLSIAKSLINSQCANNVLLVTAETYSKYIHKSDRSNIAIFGDAASATLISYSKEEHINDFLFGTDGTGYDKLIVKNGGAKNFYNVNSDEINYGNNNTYTDNHLYMNGPEIFNFTINVIPDFSLQVLEKNNKKIQSIDQFIFHQANSFMLNLIRKKLNVNKDKFYINLEDGGNTVSSSIPIALKRYIEENHIQNQEILLVGFGVGLSWAGCTIKIKNV